MDAFEIVVLEKTLESPLDSKETQPVNRKGNQSWIFIGSVAETSAQETKQYTRRVGELRFITPAGPEKLTLQALSPEQRDYRVFIYRL